MIFRRHHHQGGHHWLQDVLHPGGHRGHCDEQRGGGHLAQRRLLHWRDLPAHQRQECVLAKTRR